MRIGKLAEATGQTTKTIRFYEAQGLLPEPPRTPSRYRVYHHQDIERLEFIRKAKRLGLSLQDIRGILDLHDHREPTCLHVRSLLDDKINEVDRVLSDLQEFRKEISRLRDEAGALVDCKPSGGGICSIIERSGIQISDSTLEWGQPMAGTR